MTELINDHGLRIIEANTAHIDAISCVRCIGRKGSCTGILAKFQNCSDTGACCISRCGSVGGRRCCGLASYGRGRRAGASGGRHRTCCCRCGGAGGRRCRLASYGRGRRSRDDRGTIFKHPVVSLISHPKTSRCIHGETGLISLKAEGLSRHSSGRSAVACLKAGLSEFNFCCGTGDQRRVIRQHTVITRICHIEIIHTIQCHS